MSIVVLGAGGHAAVVVDILLAMRKDVAAVTDPDPRVHGQAILGVAVVGGDDQLPTLHARGVDEAIVAVGDNAVRCRLIDHVDRLGFRLASAIHPSAAVSPHARIGAGSAIMANAAVNARVRLGSGVIVNTGASVDHDCEIGDCVHIGPGARLGGGVRCGARSLIGIGASVIPSVDIGEDAVVGAGAAVLHDVPDRTVVIGVPARPRE